MTTLDDLRNRLRTAKTDASADSAIADTLDALDELEMLRDLIRCQQRGSEAEELRKGIETLMKEAETDAIGSRTVSVHALQRLLDTVGARDSLAFLEQLDLLKKKVEDLEGTVGAREAELAMTQYELEQANTNRGHAWDTVTKLRSAKDEACAIARSYVQHQLKLIALTKPTENENPDDEPRAITNLNNLLARITALETL